MVVKINDTAPTQNANNIDDLRNNRLCPFQGHWLFDILNTNNSAMFVLQMDSNHPVSTPWHDLCSHWLHLWHWNVRNELPKRRLSLWSRSIFRWRLKRANRHRAGSCWASGEIHGCYSQEVFPSQWQPKLASHSFSHSIMFSLFYGLQLSCVHRFWIAEVPIIFQYCSSSACIINRLLSVHSCCICVCTSIQISFSSLDYHIH